MIVKGFKTKEEWERALKIAEIRANAICEVEKSLSKEARGRVMGVIVKVKRI